MTFAYSKESAQLAQSVQSDQSLLPGLSQFGSLALIQSIQQKLLSNCRDVQADPSIHLAHS